MVNSQKVYNLIGLVLATALVEIITFVFIIAKAQTDKNLLIYNSFAIAVPIILVIIGIVYFWEDIFGKKVSFFEVLINDPEKGLLNKWFKWKFSGWNIAMFSILFGLVFSLTGTIFLGLNYAIPETPTGITGNLLKIWSAGENIVTGETFIFQLFGCSLIYGLAMLFSKNEKNKSAFYLILLIGLIFLVGASTWYHGAVYQTEEDLVSVAILFAIFNIATLLFGGIIFAWIVHDINNWIIKAREVFAGDLFALSFWIVLFMLFWIIIYMIGNYIKKERKQSA